MGKNVLLVEDNSDHQFILSSHLLAEGHQVYTAENGLSAFGVLKEHPVDLIVLDMWLPKLDGFSFLKSLRAESEWAAIPVIVATGIGQEKDVPQLQGFGIRGFFTKPYEPRELVAAISKVLA